MKILMDGSDADVFRQLNEYLPLDGVTTNPSILAKGKGTAEEQVLQLADLLDKQQTLHVQVVSSKYERMIEEAKRISETLSRDVFIKIPVSPDGLKAVRSLSEEGIRTTVTGVYTTMQAVMAAKAGAAYVAPYINRIDLAHGDSEIVINQIVQTYRTYGFSTKVLAASFKNTRQVISVMEAGVEEVTLSTDILKNLIHHKETEKSIEAFTEDFASRFENKIEMFLT
ncbi:transaldolase family protein [Terribacillus sp. AE2B 122]|jgi:TalC/MipB family fructose-6-phosphate aldolase|uniref:transaldolase family protein n=1 Tax=Terribacillus sp. AE2B 122 TaxID=1331902 RepID=UPI0015820736|nr:transaldolase family protein [Terribacillus sp. AE2B 122]